MELTKEQKQAISNARKEYMTKWREKNKHKIKQYTDTYWLKKAEEMQQSE